MEPRPCTEAVPPVAREEAARRFADIARVRFPEVQRAILFGSVARGAAGPESDIDLLLVWDGDHEEGLDRLATLAFRFLLDTGEYVSVKVLTPNELAKGTRLHNPFVEAILAEGRFLA